MHFSHNNEHTTPEHEETSGHAKREPGFFRELFRLSIIAILIVAPIRIFIAQPFIVQGASMEPTFENGQYLIVDQISYRFEEPERGDVIIFRYPRDPSKFFIKRVIGLPGETIEINGSTVSVYTGSEDKRTLNEFYIPEMRANTVLAESLGENEYFVMGDNRDHSSDSRMWGVLNRDLIIGRAFLRLLPVNEASVLPGSIDPATVDPLIQ